MASQQKNLLLQLVVEAVDRAGNVLNNIKRSLDGVQTSAQKAGDTASQTGDKLTDGLKRAADAADQTKKKFDGIAQTMAGVGAALAGIGAAISAPLAVAVKNAADFETQMNKVRAVGSIDINTSAGQQQFQALSDKALELGNSTSYSATEAAKGLEAFTRAGYHTGESLAAIGPALNLAFVEGKNLGETAEGLVNVMSALGLKADETSRVTDVLANTSAATTSSMTSLVEGMSYAAPVARNLGMSIELAAAFLGRLEENGIKAERAGTGFRRVMEDLAKPTTEARAALNSMGVQIARTAEGNLDAVTTFERLKQANMGFEQAAAIFGTYGVSVALALKNDIELVKQLEQGNKGATGTLQTMADVMNSGLNASLTKLSNALGIVSIQFAGPFLSGLKAVVDGMAGALRWFTEFGKAHPIIAKAGVAITGVFGLIVAALGALSLVIAAAAFAWGNLVKGWSLLTGKSAGIINFFREKVGAISQETRALNENTGALQRNSQARQAGQGRGQQAFTMGPTGAPMPVPTSKGAGVGLGGAAIGIGTGLLEGQMNLGPTENAISKVGELGGMLAAFGPVAGTIIAGISSWVKILTKDIWDLLDVWGVLDTKKPADAFNAKVDATLKDMDAQIAEGKTFVNSVETAVGKAVSDFGGSINQFADQWKEQFGEELPIAIRQGFAKAQDELKSSSGFAFDNIFAEAGKNANTLSGKLGAMKEVLDTLNKGTEAFYATMKATDEITFGTLRNEIVATSASQSQQAVSLADLEIQQTARRMTFVQQEYDEKKRRREQEYAAAMTQIAKDLEAEKGNAAKREEIIKQRTETEKAHRDQSLQAEKAMQDAVVAEIKKQQDAVKAALEERKKLEQDVRNEALEAQSARTSVAMKSMDETDRLKTSYQQAVTTLNMANALLPTMPEKAMEMAKKARGELTGLTQDIEGLRKKLEDTFTSNQEKLRQLGQAGMSPTAKWTDDLKEYNRLMAEATKAQNAGDFTKQEKLAAKAKDLAASMSKPPEGSELTQDQMTKTVVPLFTAAANLEEKAQKAGIGIAKGINESALGKINEAGIVIKTAQEALLDANTKELTIHREALATLSGQFAVMIDQNNKMMGGASGQQASTPEAVKAGMSEALSSAGGAAVLQQTNETLQGKTGAPGAASQETAKPIDISSFPPDMQSLFGETEALLQQSRRTSIGASAEEVEMKTRMTGLKQLEAQAKGIDTSERRGVGPSQAAEAEFQKNLDAVMGRKMTGADVDTAEQSMSRYLAGVYEKGGPAVSRGINAPYMAETTPNVMNALAQTENAATTNMQAATIMQKVADMFSKMMGTPINISVDFPNGDGTVTRY